MSPFLNLGPAAEVDAAINRVLEREREAREKIDNCRREAEDVLAASRVRAQEINARTDCRVAEVHRICDRAAETHARRILGESRSWSGASTPEPERRLEEALRILVREMVGNSP